MKSAREKMLSEAKLMPIPVKMQKRLGQGTLLIPSPRAIDALIRKVPRGKVITQAKLRDLLAKQAGADVACPITTGIFVRIVAEAAEEDLRAGKSRVTPYWRVVHDGGLLMEKLPGGPAEQARHLDAEGHRVDNSARLRLLDYA